MVVGDKAFPKATHFVMTNPYYFIVLVPIKNDIFLSGEESYLRFSPITGDITQTMYKTK